MKKKASPQLRKGQRIPAVHRMASCKGPDPFYHMVPSYSIANEKESLCAQLEVPHGINQFTLAYTCQSANRLLMLADKT